MDIYPNTRLEPIREESETEDEMEGGETGGEEEEEEEEVEDVETKEVMAEDESEEDDDVPLRVLRPRRLSRSLSEERSPQIQSSDNHQEETVNSSESAWSPPSVDLSDEVSLPRQTRLGNKRMSTGGNMRIKVSKVIMKAPRSSVAKKKNVKKAKKVSQEKPFPEWLVNLMVNIEEATTHQLVVE